VNDETGKGRERADGRRQFLVYLEPGLIKDVKRVALDRDVTAFSLVEEAVRQWLDRNKRDHPKDGDRA
jgi:hypothetical protein